jgi:plasmid stability protein
MYGWDIARNGTSDNLYLAGHERSDEALAVQVVRAALRSETRVKPLNLSTKWILSRTKPTKTDKLQRF